MAKKQPDGHSISFHIMTQVLTSFVFITPLKSCQKLLMSLQTEFPLYFRF